MYRSNSYAVGYLQKESVELILECLLEGCGMPELKQTIIMPHTCIV